MSAEPPAFPRALDDDDDDVAWALQTAGVQWERGGVADAIVWLRRAAEAAVEAGAFSRSADLQRRANELERWFQERPAFPLQMDDGDDGVDELLATDAPEIEAVATAASQSLVDALEAEARGELGEGPFSGGSATVGDLGDLEDVEDIEAVDLDDFEERQLDDYGEHPHEETTQARSSVSQAPDSLRARGSGTAPPSSRAAPSSRSNAASRAPTSSRAASSRAPTSSRASASRSPATSHSAGPTLVPQGAKAATPSLPPAPVPRLPLPLPLPLPRTTTEPPAPSRPRHEPFQSEPGTLLRNDPPSRPAERSVPFDDAEDDPTATPLAVPPRRRDESLPEIEATELEMPTLEPPSFEGPTVPGRAAAAPSSRAPAVAPISIAAPAELDAAVNALSETPPPVAVGPVLDVALVAACRGLEDLPPETQAELAAKARVETLEADQEVSDFGLALVTRGSVVVMPTIAEGACGYAAQGDPVFSRGTLSDGVSLRVVAQADGAEVAVWRPDDFEHVLRTCPWVADELRAVADRYQALAGAAMGPLGERLDDAMRAMLTDRCELMVLRPGDVLIEQGKTVAGLYVVGGGHLELVVDGAVKQELGPGDLPFASAVLTHAKAFATARAGASGTLVLHVDRMATHELIVGVPPLLELLSMA